jgi:hypothetical protein
MRLEIQVIWQGDRGHVPSTSEEISWKRQRGGAEWSAYWNMSTSQLKNRLIFCFLGNYIFFNPIFFI